MLIGYARVSKGDGSQLLDLQMDALIAAGVPSERIYQDQASGRHDDRPGLKECLKALREGDVLVIWKLDRLGRSLGHLINLVDGFIKQKIGFKVLAGQGAQIDVTTPNGKMIFGIFATLAEFERELISERTKAGLAAARARGRKGGRRRKMDASTIKMAMAAMADQKTPAYEIAKRLGITTTSLYSYVNGDGSPKEAGQKILEGGKENITVSTETDKLHHN
jgi:DNA invertase Pin-like site-specific DNA recombinase